MPTVILVRHGRTSANADGILAGRSPGVGLDDFGAKQADALATRLAPLTLSRLVTSPLKRTVQTARAIAAAQTTNAPLVRERRLIEADYGEWTGQPLKNLAKTALWKTVNVQPSAVVFPGGESMVAAQSRAVQAVREIDADVGRVHGDDALWVAVSHGDVIKSIVADALGMHLDAFQRIVVNPASVSVIRYGTRSPLVLHVNDTGADLSVLQPKKKTRRRKHSGEGVVGGGA